MKRLSPEETARRRAIIERVQAAGGTVSDAAAEIGVSLHSTRQFIDSYAFDLKGKWKRGHAVSLKSAYGNHPLRRVVPKDMRA